MAQDVNEGTAYLMVLRQARGGTAAAPALQPKTEGQVAGNDPAANSDAYQGVEKRRSPRYKCEGSAEVREDGCDVRTWVAFTDISVNGCYVEAQATYPAGTLLHMKSETNGVRVDTKGRARVTYPYLGMGIAFEDTSEENKEQLKRMLSTLSHRCVIKGPGIASTLPSTGPLSDVPLLSNPTAALQALVEFFENRQMLMRDDFLRILKKSQSVEAEPSTITPEVDPM